MLFDSSKYAESEILNGDLSDLLISSLQDLGSHHYFFPTLGIHHYVYLDMGFLYFEKVPSYWEDQINQYEIIESITDMWELGDKTGVYISNEGVVEKTIADMFDSVVVLDENDMSSFFKRFWALKKRRNVGNIERFNVVFLGDGGVGTKSAFISQLCDGHFIEEYDPTIEDYYRKEMMIDNFLTKFDLLDTAGQDEYFPLQYRNVMNADGFCLGYSITSAASFDTMKQFLILLSLAKKMSPLDIPTVIVAGKCDLEQFRQVPTEDGVSIAQEVQSKFFESSAKDRINIEEPMIELGREIRTFRNFTKENPAPVPQAQKKKFIFF